MKIRINNIEARPPTYAGKQPEHARRTLSIVKYYPNQYHGKLEEYLADGWDYSEDNICLRKDNCSISVSMFAHKESCMSIAYITYDTDECVTDLKSVGERILYLSKKDREDFFEVYELAARKLREACSDED